jgi:hypothetical protein
MNEIIIEAGATPCIIQDSRHRVGNGRSICALPFVCRWLSTQMWGSDYLRSLWEQYLVVVENVVPKIALERMTGDTETAPEMSAYRTCTASIPNRCAQLTYYDLQAVVMISATGNS